MSGSRIGGLKAAQSNKAKYGADFYARIGALGGNLGHTGGFAYVSDDGVAIGKQRAIAAGRKGGAKSRRTTGTFKHSEETKAKMRAAQKLRRAEENSFFVSDDQIDEPIEKFVKRRFYQGWFKGKEQ